MNLLLAIVGAVLGVMTSRGELFGLLAGGLIGVLWGRLGALHRQVEELQASLRNEAAMRAAQRAGERVETAPAAAATSAPPAAAQSMPTGAPPAAPVEGAGMPSPVASAAQAPAASEVVHLHVEVATAAADISSPSPDPWTQAPASAPAPPAAPAAPPPRPRIVPPPSSWGADRLSGNGPANATFEPGPIERGIDWLKRWFSEGNVPVKIGMLVLFFGVAALLKYAADQGMFSLPIELRLSAVAGAALAGLWFAWGQRHHRPAFSLGLQGGALGILLLTVFASYRLYGVLPATPAFALVLVVVAGSMLLAVLQNSMALAVLGSVGGFLAPVLLSTGQGSHVGLFSYYAVLNLAIFAVAWKRSWRPLNLVGFAFTFAIGSVWGWRYYRPEHFATTEPFLILFFLLYVGIGYLYATRQPQARRGLVDGTLLFGTPLLAAGLQAGLLADDSIALSISALAVAALYTLLAWLSRGADRLDTLSRSYASLALGFATIAVPLALDADVTAQVWALEGAGVLWLGLRQQRNSQVLAGLLLQLIAIGAWVVALVEFRAYESQALVNAVFVGGVLLAVALATSALILERSERSPPLALFAFVVALLVWAVVAAHEIDAFAPSGEARACVVLWLALSQALAAVLRPALPWPRIGWLAIVAIVVGFWFALGYWGEPVLLGWAGYAWPLWLLTALAALRALADPVSRGLSWTHVAVLSSVAMLAGDELYARTAAQLPADSAWLWLAALAPLALMLWSSLGERPLLAWPLRERFADYRQRWWLPAATVLGLAWLGSLLHAGSAEPLRYLSLLNPLELTQLGLMLLLYRLAVELEVEGSLRQGVLALAAFAWVSTITLRGVHQFAGEPWSADLWRSMLAQTSLTVVWSVLGVAAWILGSKRGSRPIWLAGAVLMGVVLAKLVLIDRQHMGNIPGIVSFLAVGLLLTVVGYLAPSPPRAAAAEPTP